MTEVMGRNTVERNFELSGILYPEAKKGNIVGGNSRKGQNFSSTVSLRLEQRVSGRCSNPNCRRQTIAGQVGGIKTLKIGEAAHITAAAPGGPRYDATLTDAQRSGFENGIWLCRICARQIDVDPLAFPVEMLLNWKTRAEKSAADELGRRLPSESEVVERATQIITGAGTRFIPNLLSNAVHAEVASLQMLDPRISVDIDFLDGNPIYRLTPLEAIKLHFSINTESDRNFFDRERDLIDHGKPLEISIENVSIYGSDLLNEFIKIAGSDGYIKIEQALIVPAIQKLRFFDRKTGITDQLDDTHGEITGGKKTLTFFGSTFDRLLEFSYRIPLTDDSSADIDFNISHNPTCWDGKDIPKLPYFNKLATAVNHMVSGHKMEFELEVQGEKIICANTMLQKNNSFISLSHQLDIIRTLRDLNSHWPFTLKYLPGLSLSAIDFELLKLIVIAFEEGGVHEHPIQGWLAESTITVILDPSESLPSKLEGPLVIEQVDGYVMQLGSQAIALPRYRHTLSIVEIVDMTASSNTNGQISAKFQPKIGGISKIEITK